MSLNNADAGDEGAIMKSRSAPEIQIDGNAVEDGRALDEATSIDPTSNAAAAPASLMTSPSFCRACAPSLQMPAATFRYPSHCKNFAAM